MVELSSTVVSSIALIGVVALGALISYIFHYINRREMNETRDPFYIPRYQLRPRALPASKPDNVFEEHELSLLRTKVLTSEELQELLTTKLDQQRRIHCSCSNNSGSESSDDKLLANPDTSSSSSNNNSSNELQHSIDIDSDVNDSGCGECECGQPKNFFTPDCSVCLLDFVAGDSVRILDCGHYFHKDCIDGWLTNHSTVCPICKTDMVVALNLPPRSRCATNARPSMVSTPEAQLDEVGDGRGSASSLSSDGLRPESSNDSAVIELQPIAAPAPVAIASANHRH